MVTFALPGEYGAADAGNGTPRSRAHLPFAKRTYAATPYARRQGTPQGASSRKFLTTRDTPVSSSLNQSSIASARNIFRASTIDSPPTSTFSPSLPQSTMKKVFAPGATPEPSRVYRESNARATPRGMAANSADKELFNMRIASPPRELSGEALANKVPKEWNSKGSIYADQFLAHLCPPDLDDEQRRQFFCILDLRRLKYAANEIFAKKGWKLNMMNFAKEFEKSRSIILLRYGLYEFQNVKPSKEVLKRWRREHGLPEPEEEEEGDDADATPTKAASSKKRKADADLSKDSATADISANGGKRRSTFRDEEEKPTLATPALNKNKRKASVSDEQPAKLQKATPSAAKSLFEKIASKPAPSATAKSANGGLARSVFTSLKPPVNGTGGGSNIFGYLSDASSAKNSGIEADAESETDSEQEDTQEAVQSDEQGADASGAGDTPSQSGSSLFGTKPAPATDVGTAASSAAGTRESTPGRSLFDRITKGQNGQPVRADESVEDVEAKQPAPANQTWNPSTTPIKFAPSASASQTTSLFGKPASSSSGTIFAPKSTTPSNIFGAAKLDQATSKESNADTSASDASKAGYESDKENDSQLSKKAVFEVKQPAAVLPSPGTSLFGQKPASTEPPKASEPAKPTSNLFGAIQGSAGASKLFGDVNISVPSTTSLSALKPADAAKTETNKGLFASSSSAAPLTGASASLFGIKPAAPAAPSAAAPAAALAPSTSTTTSNLFGTTTSTPPTSLFGTATAPKTDAASKPATSGNLFGATTSAPSTSLFGAPSSVAEKKDPASAAQPTPAPIFSFGGSSTAASKPTDSSQAAAKSLFGAPKSPPAAPASSLFAGSPMKQDEASPAKKPFIGANTDTTTAAPLFSFGAPSSAPSTNLFGGSLNTAQNTGSTAAPAFGSGSSNTGTGAGFNFNFGSGGGAPAAPSGGAFSNPFASGNGAANTTQKPATGAGGMFNFGASSTPSAPSGGSASMFQFGGSGGNQPGPTSTPIFGGASSGSAPAFNATAPSSQPSSNMFSFGASQPASGFNLQPPAGGSSTTGTNSPFNLGGGSSLATTPAGGTPEPSTQTAATGNADNDNEDGEKHEQISLTEGAEKDEEVLHDVRAKILKFVTAGDIADGEDKPKSKSPWATQGVGPLRLLKHKESNSVRLLLRAEPRGNVAMNRSVLPNMSYKADEKYVKLTTSNEKGDGLETWMIQVKTKDAAKVLAEALEKHKELNKT